MRCLRLWSLTVDSVCDLRKENCPDPAPDGPSREPESVEDECRGPTGIIPADPLAPLPKGSLLIAPSRAGMVDEAAALRGVQEGHLRGAAFDVFETEPLPDDAPHWRAPGVLGQYPVAGRCGASPVGPE
jgi:lactate dehydrogenase-like 2-hydroxyacid dehydrogenase